MKNDFAVIVGRVILGMLRMRDDLRGSARPTVDDVRDRAIGLIERLDAEARRLAFRPEDIDLARCALICWIDELLILHCDWEHGDAFRAQCLELHFPEIRRLPGRASEPRGAVEGPFLFYEMADVAKTRPDPGAAEVFYHCVALGFEGNLLGEDERREWLGSLLRHIKERHEKDPRRDADPPTVPDEGLRPLYGEHLLLGVAILVAATAAVTLAAFIVAVHLRPY